MTWLVKSRQPVVLAVLVSLFLAVSLLFGTDQVPSPSLRGSFVSVPTAVMIPLIVAAGLHYQFLFASTVEDASLRSSWLRRRMVPVATVAVALVGLLAVGALRGGAAVEATTLIGQNLAIYAGLLLIAESVIDTDLLSGPPIIVAVVSCVVLAAPMGTEPPWWALTLRPTSFITIGLSLTVLAVGVVPWERRAAFTNSED